MFPCCVLGGRIPASYSIRGSWWKPYLQASVCVPPSEKQQPAYTGIAHWNELSFWQKRKRIPGTESSSSFFFPLSLSITCQSLRKPVSCLVGFHTLVLSLCDVCLPLNYLSFIYFNGTDFLNTFSSETHIQKKAWLISEDVPICKISEGLLLLRSDKRFPKSWQLKTCCHEARAIFAASRDFESFPGTDLNKNKESDTEIKLKIRLHSFLLGLNLNTSRKMRRKYALYLACISQKRLVN